MAVPEILLKLDDRGRLTLARTIRKNGIEPSPWWRLEYGPNRTIILHPLTDTTETAEGADAA